MVISCEIRSKIVTAYVIEVNFSLLLRNYFIIKNLPVILYRGYEAAIYDPEK
jgi:hypothetical protein